jgi:hypothetical protein
MRCAQDAHSPSDRRITYVTYASPRVISADDKTSNFFTAHDRRHVETVSRQQRYQRGPVVDAEMLVDAAQMSVQGRLADAKPRPLGG